MNQKQNNKPLSTLPPPHVSRAAFPLPSRLSPRAFRPASVPDIDPHWSYEGTIGGQTRSARARSSSFYEGDDEDMMACINGET